MTKKNLNKKIAGTLRKLIEDVNTEGLDYEEFEGVNDALEKLFGELMGKKFTGFRLSESFQTLWIDPDIYLAKDSFIQRWFASKLGTHPSDITEDTVAEYIYIFLQKRFGDFKTVSLVTASSLPSPEELAGATATAAPTARGALCELTLAAGATVQEAGTIRRITRRREATAPIELVSGERDVVYLSAGSTQLSRDQRRNLLHSGFQKIQQEGSIPDLREVDLTTADFRANERPTDISPEHFNSPVQKYVYRDSSGEIHEYNHTSGPHQTLEDVFQKIREVESALAGPAAEGSGTAESSSETTYTFRA